jgi:hypothetical protein
MNWPSDGKRSLPIKADYSLTRSMPDACPEPDPGVNAGHPVGQGWNGGASKQHSHHHPLAHAVPIWSKYFHPVGGALRPDRLQSPAPPLPAIRLTTFDDVYVFQLLIAFFLYISRNPTPISRHSSGWQVNSNIWCRWAASKITRFIRSRRLVSLCTRASSRMIRVGLPAAWSRSA